MPDEVGTEATRSDAPSADDSLFGDKADDTPATAAEEKDSDDAVADEQDSNEESAQDPQGAGDAEEQAVEDETGSSEDLKVVVSIKDGRATIGVQRPSSDSAHRDVRRPGPIRAVTGGLGGGRKGEGQVGGRAQASGLRETRSPAQAPEPARAGGGAGGVNRNVGADAGTTADAEAVLGGPVGAGR